MTKYTAADFANAKFAEHESGQAVALRWTQDYGSDPDDYWVYERPLNNRFSKEATHQEMADMGGWVPVPTKPTITSRRYQILMRYENAHYHGGFNDALTEFGIEIVDGPEPANTDRLKQLIKDYDECDSYISLPEFLDQFGVTAPNVKGN